MAASDLYGFFPTTRQPLTGGTSPNIWTIPERAPGALPANQDPTGSLLDYQPGPLSQLAYQMAGSPKRPPFAGGMLPPAYTPSSGSGGTSGLELLSDAIAAKKLYDIVKPAFGSGGSATPGAGGTTSSPSGETPSSAGGYTFTPGYDFLGGPAQIPNGLQNLDYSKPLQDYATTGIDKLNTQLNADPNIQAAGNGVSVGDAAKGALGAYNVYGGLKQGGVQGYANAAGGAAQIASAAGVGGSTVANAVPVLGAITGGYGTLKSIQAGNVKGGVVSGAATGASIGSIVPGIGTLVGGIIGGVVGGVGAAIHGKDYQEEKTRDNYYGLLHETGATDTSSLVDPKSFYQSVAGEFRGSHSAYPPRASGSYGKKDEDAFIQDLGTKINQAYSAGTIGQGATAEDILNKVVDPWFQKDFGGWRQDIPAQWVADQKAMTLDLINRYISGSPVDWGVINGGAPNSDHPVPRYAGLPPEAAPAPQGQNNTDLYRAIARRGLLS